MHADLFNILKGLFWFILVYFDNRIRFILNYSPLVKMRAKAASRHHIPLSLTKNASIRKVNGHDTTSSRAQSSSRQLKGTYIYHTIYDRYHADYNLAIILRFLLEIRQRLNEINKHPSTCHLIHAPTQYISTFFFNYFSGQETRAKIKETYRLQQLVILRNIPYFWRLWDHQDNIEAFRREMLAMYDIKAAPPAKSVRRILLICRHNTNTLLKGRILPPRRKIIVRKFSNEKEILAQLIHHFPSQQIDAVALEEITITEQFSIINKADIVIGMHGAGLGYNLLMKPNSGLLEIFPFSFVRPHQFYTFYAGAAARRLHYRRYLQPFPWRDRMSRSSKKDLAICPHDPKIAAHTQRPSKDYSEIAPAAIIKRTHQLISDIHKRA